MSERIVEHEITLHGCAHLPEQDRKQREARYLDALKKEFGSLEKIKEAEDACFEATRSYMDYHGGSPPEDEPPSYEQAIKKWREARLKAFRAAFPKGAPSEAAYFNARFWYQDERLAFEQAQPRKKPVEVTHLMRAAPKTMREPDLTFCGIPANDERVRHCLFRDCLAIVTCPDCLAGSRVLVVIQEESGHGN